MCAILLNAFNSDCLDRQGTSAIYFPSPDKCRGLENHVLILGQRNRTDLNLPCPSNESKRLNISWGISFFVLHPAWNHALLWCQSPWTSHLLRSRECLWGEEEGDADCLDSASEDSLEGRTHRLLSWVVFQVVLRCKSTERCFFSILLDVLAKYLNTNLLIQIYFKKNATSSSLTDNIAFIFPDCQGIPFKDGCKSLCEVLLAHINSVILPPCGW